HVRSCVRRSGVGGDGVQRLGADVLLRVPLWRQVRDLPRGSIRRRGHRAVSQLHAANQGPLRRERTPGAETRGRRGRAWARQPRRRTGCRGIDARRGTGVGVLPACRLPFWLECSCCPEMFLLHRDLLMTDCFSVVNLARVCRFRNPRDAGDIDGGVANTTSGVFGSAQRRRAGRCPRLPTPLAAYMVVSVCR
ncbi:unnamed protein product, partial [Ectocarpus sp. 4 AP-2014]